MVSRIEPRPASPEGEPPDAGSLTVTTAVVAKGDDVEGDAATVNPVLHTYGSAPPDRLLNRSLPFTHRPDPVQPHSQDDTPVGNADQSGRGESANAVASHAEFRRRCTPRGSLG